MLTRRPADTGETPRCAQGFRTKVGKMIMIMHPLHGLMHGRGCKHAWWPGLEQQGTQFGEVPLLFIRIGEGKVRHE